MGSGSRFKIVRNGGGVWFGFGVDNMPFHYTLGVSFGWYTLQIGIGKAYDEYETGDYL